MRQTLRTIGLAATLATLTAIAAACGPDDRYDTGTAGGTGADRGVGAGAGTTTTNPGARPTPAP